MVAPRLSVVERVGFTLRGCLRSCLPGQELVRQGSLVSTGPSTSRHTRGGTDAARHGGEQEVGWRGHQQLRRPISHLPTTPLTGRVRIPPSLWLLPFSQTSWGNPSSPSPLLMPMASLQAPHALLALPSPASARAPCRWPQSLPVPTVPADAPAGGAGGRWQRWAPCGSGGGGSGRAIAPKPPCTAVAPSSSHRDSSWEHLDCHSAPCRCPHGGDGDTCPVLGGFPGGKQSWGRCCPWGMEQAAWPQCGTAGFAASATAPLALYQAPPLHAQHQAQPRGG